MAQARSVGVVPGDTLSVQAVIFSVAIFDSSNIIYRPELGVNSCRFSSDTRYRLIQGLKYCVFLYKS